MLLARELATVDVLSGGRLLPAGGLGIDLPIELEAMGVLKEERVARMEESVAIIKALWSGEPVTRSGRFWSLTEARLQPVPSRAKLEFWLGGVVPAALRRIGRIADGWLASFVGPDEMPGKIAIIREAAAEAGRSIDEDHYGATIWAAPDERDVPGEAWPLLDRRAGLAREDHVAIGTAEVRELLERFVAGGASKFVVIPIARDLIPWLHELRTEAVAPVEVVAGSSEPV
jgi:alkanesulfonate monooxygenase SsuD/methylene tetrahydromethanopterin reductase-like flavin-dependent oxidoreductase (luciferase family)